MGLVVILIFGIIVFLYLVLDNEKELNDLNKEIDELEHMDDFY